MLDETYNKALRAALVGRVIRADALPPLVQGERVLSLWGEEAGIPDWDIHATRAYRIYLDVDDARTITGVGILVDGELLSPCCGYALEALDELDFPFLRDWCLEKLEEPLRKQEDGPMETVYQDNRIYVCIKPAGVRSTDEEGGLPSLIRQELRDPQACVRTVHRLDQPVGGLMVLARSRVAASVLARQVREGGFEKEYLAVVHGTLPETSGTLVDLLLRSKAERKTYVVTEPQKDAQEAVLDYTLLRSKGDLSLVRIRLHTGRTHQIRVQFASRGYPLVGDRKYGRGEDCPIALWSYRLCFCHPETGERLEFTHKPPECYPWTAV